MDNQADICTDLVKRGWPAPEFVDSSSSVVDVYFWGFDGPLSDRKLGIPYLHASVSSVNEKGEPLAPGKFLLGLSYLHEVCGGNAKRRGSVSELIEAMDRFRWVLPSAKT